MTATAGGKPLDPAIGYDDGKTLMARGPLALHEHVASRLETSLGKALPQMEVRFKDVSISADIVVKDASDLEVQLPTLPNEMMKTLHGLVAKKHTVTKRILRGISGVLKSGTVTLVLGQPGSGKSSLMKLLSGRFPKDKSVSIEGEVAYNGTSTEELHNRLPQLVSYVPQRDKHYPELTVKETLEFAHAACGGELSERDASHLVNGTPDENAEALKAAQALAKHYPDVVIQQLGLENCQNTIVGDAMLRGVSGGERKRVTTGELSFGNKYVMMMDEISTGLDSAATFDIITTQRSLAKKFHKTVVISLLQPSPEVFALFDDVMILNGGHLMYHGPCKEALGYFETLGFKCPPSRDVADFLLDIGTNKQYQYEVKLERGGAIPRTPSEFADAFKLSTIYSQTLRELEDSVNSSLVEDMKTHMMTHPEFSQSFWASTSLLMKRQLTITKRETTALIGRLIMNTIIALLCSSVYYQFDLTDFQVAMGIMFEAILNLSIGQAAQIPTVMAARDVFYKQRGANFFRTASYVLSNFVNQAPPIILESVIFGTIIYWMCGFVSSFWSFLIFLVVLCLTNLALAAFFFFLASASPNLNVANPISSVAVLYICVFAGYTITKDQIPDYLIWLYWGNPIAWGIRALAVSQYTHSRFDTCVYNGFDYCAQYGMKMGEYSLSTYEVPSDKFWLWYGMVFMVATYVFFLFLSCIALEYHRFERPENVVLTTQTNTKASDSYTITRTPRGSQKPHESVISVDHAREKYFVPVTVAFKDLWYTVPDPTNPKKIIDLLKGISGYALPGTITALMGSSGAGKTTLMDVIAGRKTGGQIRGQILLNGHPATDLAIRRSTGYCEQMDIHSESSTIREALTFSAFLRQGADVPDSHKYDSVNECLDLLDLNLIADQIIRGSSVEQMKRLTIGVELAAQPSVLFLDEPTSGLDARSAKLIMDGVRKVADTGRTIVCTIHQPSSEVFSVFDSLLLLKRGGETVFAGDLGENAREMIEYFESIEGVTKLETDYNPATWMLEVIGAGVGNSNGDQTDFVETFKASAHFKRLQSSLDREGVTRPSPSLPALEFSDKRAASELTQAKFLLKRFCDLYWRTPSFNLTRFAISLGMGLAYGITYVGAEYKSYSGVNSGMGMVYMITSFIGLISFNGLIPVAYEERAVFYRERASQTYNAFWYFFGLGAMEIPYAVVAVLLFLIPFFPMVGFSGVGAFLISWLVLVLQVLHQAFMAELLVFLLPNLEVAEIVGVLLNLLGYLFSGFSPPASTLPSATVWLYGITPMKYSMAAFSAVVFGDCSSEGDLGCTRMTNVPPSLPENITVKEYLETNFLMKHSEIWRNCGFLLLFVLLFGVFTLLAMRFLNYQKK
ncbi:Pleiotropic drug resistance protein 1 [Phytophthora cactorum]|nr:Pleiotropic drug resistance protein 1 [Phytophthora cactorum]